MDKLPREDYYVNQFLQQIAKAISRRWEQRDQALLLLLRRSSGRHLPLRWDGLLSESCGVPALECLKQQRGSAVEGKLGCPPRGCEEDRQDLTPLRGVQR